MRRAGWLAMAVAATGTLCAQAPFTVTPGAISFGNVVAGTITTARAVTLTAAPNSAITITSISSDLHEFVLFNVPAGSFFLSAGEPVTIAVAFAPDALANFNGKITVTGMSSFSAAPFTQTVSLTGTGSAPFSVSPASLSFGNVLLGCNASQAVTITPLVPLDFSLTASGSGFSVSQTSFSAFTNQNVAVTFKPPAQGSASGSLTIIASQQGATIQTVTIALGGVGVDLTVTPNTIDFGTVVLGTTSAGQTVHLATNPPVSGSFQVSSGNSVFAATPVSSNGDTQITFTPSSAGSVTSTLTLAFTGSDPSCPIVRTLSVTGTGAVVAPTISPTSIDFGNVAVGTTSQPPQTATLTNNSTVSLNGTVSSSNSSFLFSPASFTLGGSKSQSFNLNFKPPSVGPQTGVITFTLATLATSGPPSAALSTTVAFTTTVTLAVKGQGQACDLSLSPTSSLDFGDVGVQSSATQSVTVTDSGGGQCDVTATAAGGPFAVSPGSFSLTAGKSQQVSISFAPTAAGSLQGTATFAATGVSRSLTLAGRGVLAPAPPPCVKSGATCAPVLPGGTISLPRTLVGSSNTIEVDLNNSAGVVASVNSITTNDPVFALENLPKLPASVPPGGSLSFVVRFLPDLPRLTNATLNIDSSTFSLIGTGVVTGATINGTGGTVGPAQQPNVGVTLGQSYKTPLTGRLTLTFGSNALGAPDDPAIQFAGGGRSINFTLPAGATAALFGSANQIAFQSGTVAGAVRFAATFADAAGNDVTPPTPPSGSVTINRSGPVISSATLANRSSSGFQVVIVGFATTREVNLFDGQFTGASGATLRINNLPVNVGTAFANFFNSTAAALFGGLFNLTVPFTVDGDINTIRSFSFTLSNGDGASAATQVTVSP